MSRTEELDRAASANGPALPSVPVIRRSLLPVVLLPIALPACKGSRGSLEGLVPDGATALVSIDAKAITSSKVFATAKAALGDNAAEAQQALDELAKECSLDFDEAKSVVLGFDLLSRNVMGAVTMPNIGKREALDCMVTVASRRSGKAPFTVSEADGKATVSFDDGEAEGWALADDTLVISSKGWTSAVQGRMKGEGKGAVDHNLADAVALADRSKHIWFAGQVPGLLKSKLVEAPQQGLELIAGHVSVGEDLGIGLVAAYADETTALAAKQATDEAIAQFGPMAQLAGIPAEAVASIEIEASGVKLSGKMTLPATPLITVTNEAFAKYIARSKTSESRVQIAKMFDGAASYFNEEHLNREDPLAAMPHACPNDGRTEGEAGMTPPLSVRCSDGPSGKCAPGQSGDGGYDMKVWTDNPVWKQIDFQVESPHYFHYNFRWKNFPSEFGSCQFTAQAFGDLDGDGVFSTYERAGAADEMGVNAAAGLYIDQELE